MFAVNSSSFDPRAASSSSFFNQHAMQQPSGHGSGSGGPSAGGSNAGQGFWNRSSGQQQSTPAQRLYDLGGPPAPMSTGSFAHPSPSLGPQHSPYGASAALAPAPAPSRVSSESSRFAYYPPETSRDIGAPGSSASSWTEQGSPIMSSYPSHSSYHGGVSHASHMSASPYGMPQRAGSHYFAGAQGTERGNSPPPIWEGSDMGSPRLPQALSAPSTSHGARSLPSSYAMAGRSLGRPGSPPFGPSAPLSLLPAGGSLLPPLVPSSSMPSSFLPATGDMAQHHMYNAHRSSYPGSAYGYGAAPEGPTGYTSLPPPVAHAHDAYGNVEVKPHYFNAFEVKHRRRTTKAQFKVLEGTFRETPKPSAAVRKAISDQLNMPPRAVQIWFQNRRAKAKAVSKKEAEKNGKTAEASASASDGQDLGNQDHDDQDEVEQSPEQEQSPREPSGSRHGEAGSSRLPPPPSYPNLSSGSSWQRGY